MYKYRYPENSPYVCQVFDNYEAAHDFLDWWLKNTNNKCIGEIIYYNIEKGCVSSNVRVYSSFKELIDFAYSKILEG